MVDVNQDGHVEVLIAVSYYFDKEEYETAIKTSTWPSWLTSTKMGDPDKLK